MHTLTIHDETATGRVLHTISLQFQEEYISVKDLIEARIRQEIAHYEAKVDAAYLPSLVQPSKLESRLNAKGKNKKRAYIDPEKQLYVALEAFQRNGFFILIDDEQAEDLDQRFLVDDSTQVSFIKLTPLVGG